MYWVTGNCCMDYRKEGTRRCEVCRVKGIRYEGATASTLVTSSLSTYLCIATTVTQGVRGTKQQYTSKLFDRFKLPKHWQL